VFAVCSPELLNKGTLSFLLEFKELNVSLLKRRLGD
jgi:hypothetical protein